MPRRSSIAFLALLLSAALLVLPVRANGPVGIAFVEAPEQSSGMCTGNNPDAAFACAREKCVAGGAEARDCLRVAWCYPAGWTADVFVQHKEGPHWHEYSCGWDSKETLHKAAAVKCDPALRDYLMECAIVQIFDPQGNQIPVE